MGARRSAGIREMPLDEQPRERLFALGSASLTKAELLAILLNTGSKGEPVTMLAQRMLAEHGDLRGLMRLDVAELSSIKGVGPAKAAKVAAAFELASRIVALGPDERPRITTPEDIVRLVGPEMGALDHEQLRVILTDTRHRVVAIRTLYKGTVNQSNVRVGEVFRDAIRNNATAIAVAHNHPSGDPAPSAADVSLTAALEEAGELLGIDVLDHVIVTAHDHVSLRRLGLGFSRKS